MSYAENIEQWTKPLNSPLHKVEFTSSGCPSKNWTVNYRKHEICADTLIAELRMKSGVMSRGIDFHTYKDDQNKIGVFVGIFRHIGDIQITELESATE